MFNSYNNYVSHSHGPSSIAIVEKRAPTDESVKLLKEMEEAALNKIIASGRVEDNIFNTKWYITCDTYSGDDEYCRCIFTLNGEEHDFKFKLPGRYCVHEHGMEGILTIIKEQILKRLSEIFTRDLFSNHRKLIIEKYVGC